MVRPFRLTGHAGGRFLEAIERHGAAWAGLRFVLPVPAGEPPPWGEMRAQIRAWLARRDVARHPRSGRLELVAGSLRGQIASVGDAGQPKVLVRGLENARREPG